MIILLNHIEQYDSQKGEVFWLMGQQISMILTQIRLQLLRILMIEKCNR